MLHTGSLFRPCACGIIHRPEAEMDALARDVKAIKNMFVTATLKNLMLAAVATASATNPDFASLHTAYSATGTNEVTGGSPAYARKAITWSSPASGSTALNGTLPSFDVPTGTTVQFVGGFDAVTSGTFLFMQALGAQTYKPAMMETSTDLTNNDIFCDTHGYVADNRVCFWPITGLALPTGIAQGTIYWVISTGLATDSFRVSATQGGSAIDLTDPSTLTPFGFLVQRCIPQTTVTQDVISIASLTFDGNILN